LKLGKMYGRLLWDGNRFSKWTAGKQLVDAADGISAVMIEGYYHNRPGYLVRFFQYSLSSAKET